MTIGPSTVMTRWLTVTLQWVLLSVCVLWVTPAMAGELDTDELTKDQTRAVLFCQQFSETVQANVSDCQAMGAALQKLIDTNEEFVRRMASTDNDDVADACMLHLELAVEGLIACGESEAVAAALARFDEIGREAANIGPEQVDRSTRPELAQLQMFCADFSTAVASVSDGDCDAIAKSLGPVTELHKGVYARWNGVEPVDDTERRILSNAVADCMSAMMQIPDACQKHDGIVTALERLDAK